MNAAIANLVSAQPDPRWATILTNLMEKTNQLIIPPKKDEIHPYHRPVKFSPKQHLITDHMLSHLIKFLFVVGCQRGGKTTCIFNALTELVLSNTSGHPLQFDLMCGKGEQADRILRNAYYDQVIYENNIQQIPQVLSTKCIWHDGSRLDTHETTVGDIKGSDADVVWIDEFDVAIKKDALAVQTAINTALAKPNMLIVMSSNQDQGMYQWIKQKFQEYALTSEKFAFVEIYPQDCPWLTEAGNIEVVTAVSNLLVGETTTKMRLENKFTGTGDQFDPESIHDAYAIYETLLATDFKTPKPITECDYRILSIDPSGTGHPFGWILLGVKTQHIIDFQSGMMQMGYDPSGQKWSGGRIDEFFLKICRENYVRCVVLENNTYGSGLIVFLQNHGIKVEVSVRGMEGTDNSLSNFIRVAHKVFEDRLIALQNPDLRGQLSIYDPLERGKGNNQFKGDIADALINGIWYCVGGIKYISGNVIQVQEQKVAWF
jgi:hypothetical protein